MRRSMPASSKPSPWPTPDPPQPPLPAAPPPRRRGWRGTRGCAGMAAPAGKMEPATPRAGSPYVRHSVASGADFSLYREKENPERWLDRGSKVEGFCGVFGLLINMLSPQSQSLCALQRCPIDRNGCHRLYSMSREVLTVSHSIVHHEITPEKTADERAPRWAAQLPGGEL